MAQIPSPFDLGSQSWERPGVANPALVRFFNAVYAWMCVGLLVTAGVANYMANHFDIVQGMGNGVLLLFVVEIVLVMAISGAVQRINAAVATLMFVVFAAINGVVLSSIFMVYAHSTIASAFAISAGTFGVMSIFGMVTRTDLSAIGRIAIMALIGIIIASVVSFFWHNSMLQVVINYVGVLVFVALTAYDTQRLKAIAVQTQDNPALASRMAIVGSLTLYLDFINLFLFILQILGDRRR